MKEIAIMSVFGAIAGVLMFFMWTIGTGDINIIMGVK